jgi:hypothetical protein
VRHWAALPPNAQLREGDIVVLDLLGRPPLRCQPVSRLPSACHVLAIFGDGPINGGWIKSGERARAKFVFCGGDDSRECLAPAIAAIARHLEGPATTDIVRAIVTRSPRLIPASAIVRAICEDVWRIRRPCDLANACGVPRQQLLDAAADIGFKRVEHLTTAVRQLMRTSLRTDFGTPGRLAWSMAGVRDTSNHRRQLARASTEPH